MICSETTRFLLTMDTTYFYPLIRYQAFTSSDFLAACGGVMGLIAGISIFSIIEFMLPLIKSLKVTICKSRIAPEDDYPRNRPPRQFLINRDHLLYHLSLVFAEFLKKSSIHGVHYINDKGLSLKVKVFWLLAITASVISCSILVNDSLRNLQLNSVIVVLDEKIWNDEDVRRFCKTKARRNSDASKNEPYRVHGRSIFFACSPKLEKYERRGE